jgi:hypothetical protein
MFKFCRLALIPFVLFALTLFAMGVHATVTTMYHRSAWPETVATILETQMATLPNGKRELAVAVSYIVDGKASHWEGLGKDIGLYEGEPGDLVSLHYDPSDPTQLDTAMMKGWRGALLMLAITGGIVIAYLWFFWLRGGRRRGPPDLPASLPQPVEPYRSAPDRSAFRKPTQAFGKR